MSKRDIRKEPTWRLALRFGIVFTIVVIIIQFIWEFVASGNLNAIPKSIDDGSWINYAVSKVIVGSVYGLIMAYFTKRNAKK